MLGNEQEEPSRGHEEKGYMAMALLHVTAGIHPVKYRDEMP